MTVRTIQLCPRAFLYHGDMMEALDALPDNCIDAFIGDPPYHFNSIVQRFGADDAKPALSAAQRRFAASGGADRPPGTDQFGRLSKGFMGKQWDGGDIAFRPETWRKVFRVLKPGAHLAAFGAPKNFGRLQVAIFDAGFEERDTLLHVIDPDDAVVQFLDTLNGAQLAAFFRCMAQSEMSGMLAWTFGSGFPKSQNVARFIDDHKFGEWLDADHARRCAFKLEMRAVGMIADETTRRDAVRQTECRWRDAAGLPLDRITSPEAQEFDGYGSALKPAFEPIVLARKPLSEATIAANVLRWRTGAINVDGCRIGTELRVNMPGSTKPRVAMGGGWREDAAPTFAEGRFPANLTHDGSVAVLERFPDSKGQQASLTGNEPSSRTQNVYGKFASRAATTSRFDIGSAARFFYNAKANKADRAGSKHPTVKPLNLLGWLVELLCPPGGTVLDTFAGSGTTGAAAVAAGRNVVMVEREDEYVADIQRRFESPPLAPT